MNAYGVISLVRLIAAPKPCVWQLLAWQNPVVIPGLRAGVLSCVAACVSMYALYQLQSCKCVSVNILCFTLGVLRGETFWMGEKCPDFLTPLAAHVIDAFSL